MSSTFEVPVVKIKLEPHGNADSLSLVKVFGWQVVVRTEDWKDGDLAAWVPPDSIVPSDDPQFAFLDGHWRIKTRRFRKEWSHGFFAKPPSNSREGDNVAETMRIIPYEPPTRQEGMSSRERKKLPLWRRVKLFFTEQVYKPKGQYPHYDVEHLRRFLSLIPEGTEVIITEKIHGANGLYVCKKPWLRKPKIYMRSRTVWKFTFDKTGAGYFGSNIWKRALEINPELQRFLKEHPNVTVYGEVYGEGVQDLTYGSDQPRFVAFDIWDSEGWEPKETAFQFLQAYRVPCVPILYNGPFNFDQAVELANKKSTLAGNGQVSEGIVVTTKGFNRRQLKLVSDLYLEKAK